MAAAMTTAQGTRAHIVHVHTTLSWLFGLVWASVQVMRHPSPNMSSLGRQAKMAIYFATAGYSTAFVRN